ncbi:hypothetical protein QTL95_21780 [Rhizobium sp. S152]|uniref:hypothetical protein n=1 Tax=Rhizobium sp. S152 TaxID=3055038 RepID=UPI0025AA2176|nr:hypothetical protein [Rhizobium sp. S152]MDM9628532.1 hypothetical protein [Rhizobium sp. S152]
MTSDKYTKAALTVIAVCLAGLLGERIYDRLATPLPARVYVMGGDLSVTVDGGTLSEVDRVGSVGSLGSVDDTIGVDVKGGKLDYETDAYGTLKVSTR